MQSNVPFDANSWQHNDTWRREWCSFTLKTDWFAWQIIKLRWIAIFETDINAGVGWSAIKLAGVQKHYHLTPIICNEWIGKPAMESSNVGHPEAVWDRESALYELNSRHLILILTTWRRNWKLLCWKSNDKRRKMAHRMPLALNNDVPYFISPSLNICSVHPSKCSFVAIKFIISNSQCKWCTTKLCSHSTKYNSHRPVAYIYRDEYIFSRICLMVPLPSFCIQLNPLWLNASLPVR